MAVITANEDEARSQPVPGDAARARAEHYRALDVAPRQASRAATAIPMFERGASNEHRWRWQDAPATVLRAKKVDWNGVLRFHLEGKATTWDQPYEMWDFFGPYEEEVAPDALAESLAAGPDVAFLVNHTGLSMARTVVRQAGLSPSLVLAIDDVGLDVQAWLDPKRNDVQDLVSAIEDDIITEMSFAFVLLEGWWNQDFTRFRITKADIDRGDVSAVNYGANPYTSVAARASDVLAELERIPLPAARAALARLSRRIARETTQGSGEPLREVRSAEDQSPSTGRSVTQIEALIATSRIG